MKVKVSSILVDDQERALKFYTGILGFVKKFDIPVGDFRWLTVVSPEAPDEVELVLEPDAMPEAQVFKRALKERGTPYTAFQVDDVQQEYARLVGLGVQFSGPPANQGPITGAVLDDTCGNLIQIYQVNQP